MGVPLSSKIGILILMVPLAVLAVSVTNDLSKGSATQAPPMMLTPTPTPTLVPTPTPVRTRAAASFVAVADTHAQQDKPNANYGTNTTMLVKTWATAKNARAFVQFDVSAIPAGSKIDSATLTLCATEVASATRTYNLHRVTTSWVETTLTWHDQPAVVATVTDSETTRASPGCMSWTVTVDVQAWVDGTANHGWRVSDPVENDPEQFSEFRTRDDSVGVRHLLDVAFTVP